MSQLDTPRQLFIHKLGAALAMEQSGLALLEVFQQRASHPKLQVELEQHRRETMQQLQNLHYVCETVGAEPEPQPSPVIEGLQNSAEQLIRVSPDLVDWVILDSLIQSEHHELAVYNALIISAETIGEEDLVPLFQENLEAEKHALDEIVKAAEQVSYQLAKQSS